MDSPPSPNTAYTAHFIRPNFGFAETSYMPGTLYKMAVLTSSITGGQRKCKDKKN